LGLVYYHARFLQLERERGEGREAKREGKKERRYIPVTDFVREK